MAGVLAALIAASASGALAVATPLHRVLILDSFGREFAPYNTLIGNFKTEMARRSSVPLEFHEIPLEMSRFTESDVEGPLVEYVRALFAYRHLDLVVPVGGAAMRFWERHRAELFPSAPTLFTGVDLRHLQDITLDANQTAAVVQLDLAGVVEDILRLLPETTQIAVVLGSSPLERFWAGEADREWRPFAGRVRFIWWNDLSFADVRQRAATLPRGSCILYLMMSADANGVPYEDDHALALLHSEADAPIFGLFSSQLGRGIVGGHLLDLDDLGSRTVRAALEILDGEPPASVRMPPMRPATPTFDWRELRRWRIRSASLPAGSVVLHREPNVWEKQRWKILLGAGIFAAQALALGGLLVQRARRRRAEQESERRRRELLHASRVSTLGELTASLAHELHQPLGAILRNAEAAELLMQRSPPDLEEVQAILADIRHDDARAAQVIDRLRGLLKRHALERRWLAIGDLFDEVQMLVRGDALSHGVRIEMDAPVDLPRVMGDRVHLVQVLLNLLVNAVDASRDSPDAARTISVHAERHNGTVEVGVRDAGHGIAAADLERVFEPFHTTKPNGLGLGLSISRSIIEAHGGRVWACKNPTRGTTFCFTLPIEGKGHRA